MSLPRHANASSACCTSTATSTPGGRTGPAVGPRRPGLRRSGQRVGDGDRARREAECAHGAAAPSCRRPAGDATPRAGPHCRSLHHSDGVILVTALGHPAQRTSSSGRGAVRRHRPDRPAGHRRADIGATNWAGGLAATEHLLELGHRRIGMIGGRTDMLCSQARIDGYRAALERGRHAVDRDLIRHGDFHHESGSGAASAARPPRAAHGHLRRQRPAGVRRLRGGPAARAEGPRGPQRGRLRRPAAVDGPSPPLTTVRQPLEEMGRLAARTLFQLLEASPWSAPGWSSRPSSRSGSPPPRPVSRRTP